jgi:hypothetical protein
LFYTEEPLTGDKRLFTSTIPILFEAPGYSAVLFLKPVLNNYGL